ncbi:hypothetical protein HG15A2_31790 [Adhaeretor mobilis]|uniref:Uncharacterized protein n=1 Tax=Adhaeretor mobilis TaxID=1930276 RepID=A0A517MY97_9BACT|nr:hypothetical protein HG15A2_31790 [Adhaeretor mobilis]
MRGDIDEAYLHLWARKLNVTEKLQRALDERL